MINTNKSPHADTNNRRGSHHQIRRGNPRLQTLGRIGVSDFTFQGYFLKAVENLLEKWYALSNERTVVGAKIGAKALVENVAT